MSFYDALRRFADSWGLIFLFLVFLAAILWVLRPGGREHYRKQGEIPFKHDKYED
ncbi:cbb3-type cytochrome c oxidase subunit 3 [Propylenella binzhouense]|uniref:Cbb3-type cytochrome c oxidase subunit 3 n=1 Tax=Propylenella binzhouense TaxID=2555902 RepID=A0A964T5G7_9HYPH|nr:cbb3-type cytochrome c oxidase subunit 3 [Propylenella binzhouense]MYZ48744.1 cbb3-type cytochrome c oxidase subunit 3 [Propylenella binzhouense]